MWEWERNLDLPMDAEADRLRHMYMEKGLFLFHNFYSEVLHYMVIIRSFYGLLVPI